MNFDKYKGVKIIKRNDGRWQARFTSQKKRHTIYGKTKQECYENLKAVLKEKPIMIEKAITFYDYWNYWYKNYKEPFYKEGTLKNYRSVFNNQITPNFPNKALKSITALEINLFIKNLPDNRMKEYTCQYLREIFKQAYHDNKIKTDIWEDIKTYHHKRKEGNALTVKQRQILIDKAKNSIYDIFVFYLFTGCRRSEGLNIKTSDFEKDLLHIQGTKTNGSDRWIPILTPIKELYEKYKDNKPTLFNISETTLKRRRVDFQKICGFNFQTKDLRTTFATMCAEKGVSPKIIAKWLGHTTTQTTNKYYIKVLDKYEKEQIKLIDTSFKTTKKPKK